MRIVVGSLALLLLALSANAGLSEDTPSPKAAGDSLTVATKILETARKSPLGPAMLDRAAALLADADPFVRGAAEWAIAVHVGRENNSDRLAWPKPDAPQWYRRWAAVSPESYVEMDYVRQAIAVGLHQDVDRLKANARRVVARAEAAADAGTQSRERLVAMRGSLDRLNTQTDLREARQAWLALRRQAREVVLAQPAIDFRQLLFVTRYTAHAALNITRSFPWKHKPGGDICILDGLNPAARPRPLLDGCLGPGFVWGLDLWWDADRVAFAYARLDRWPLPMLEDGNFNKLRLMVEPIHIFEARLDGSQVRQITDHPVWSDFEPAYCANGDIVFPSDRKGNAAECGSRIDNDISNPNLFISSPDGKRVRHLTDFKDLDRYPRTLDNGLIAFTRWEYQERGFLEVHAIWTIRPDGTMPQAVFGHHLPAPYSFRDSRSVPRSDKLISIATGHHCFSEGVLVLVEPSRGLNDRGAIRIVTPGVKPLEGPMAGTAVAEGGVEDAGGMYRDPWALSETTFLAAYSYDHFARRAPANGFALYLVDVWGNKELVYRDPLLSCVEPTPLKPRPRPPVIPSAATDDSWATCYVSDVYEGWSGEKRHEAKYLRIAQHVPWPMSADNGMMMPYLPGNASDDHFGYWAYSPVRVIGTVPVEADGSAHFRVPADTAVYFQLLDENQMEIRRMRSMIAMKAGETRGCTGCHESQERPPMLRGRMPLAVQRQPDAPVPLAWGNQRTLDYEPLIQPILDRHCASCHGGDKLEAGLDFTARRDADGYLQSYRTMFGVAPGAKITREMMQRMRTNRQPGQLISVSDRRSDSGVTEPYQFGSHRSRLILSLRENPAHDEVRLPPDDWATLVAWVDANAPYYGSFLNRSHGDIPQREHLALPLALGDR